MTASRDIAARLTPGERIIEGAKEALAIARGEIPAARIHHNGHTYVPEALIASLRLKVEELERSEDAGLAKVSELAHKLKAMEDRVAALEDQNRALEAATIEKCAKVADELSQWSRRGSIEWEPEMVADSIAARIRALASITWGGVNG